MLLKLLSQKKCFKSLIAFSSLCFSVVFVVIWINIDSLWQKN